MKKSFGKKLLPFALACALFCMVGVTACKKTGDGGETGGEQNGNTDNGSNPSTPSTGGHEHAYAYAFDGDGHWQVCAECGNKTESAAHTIADGVCTVCAYRTLSSGLAFELNEDGQTYTLAGIGTCADSVVGVPQEYEGKPVTGVKAAAFANNGTITSITFPSTVTEIGSMAFFNCAALQAATLPDSLTDMGAQVFGECILLKRVKIGSGLTEIPIQTFYECSDLVSVVFSSESQIRAIGVSAFDGCASMTEIKLPSTIDTFSENAFARCSALQIFTFGEETESIGAGCFEGCTSLFSVTFAEKNAWYVCEDTIFVDATEVSAAELASAATAAELITQTYVGHYWKRGELPELPVDPSPENPLPENPSPENPSETGDELDPSEEEQRRLEEQERLEEEQRRLEEEQRQLEEERRRQEEEERRQQEENNQKDQNGGN